MRKSKFIEKFDSEFNELVPDNKEQIKTRLGIAEPKAKKNKSYIFAKPLLAFSLLLVMVIGLSALIPIKKDGPTLNLTNMGSVIKTKEDVYAYSALSTSTLLSKNKANALDLSNKNVSDEELNKINSYISMFDSLISEEGFSQVTSKNDNSEYSQYETKMIVSVGNINYISYYNEIALNEDEDEEDDEVETSLDGIMILNDVEYKISGTKEIEDDEVEISITSKIDDLNYVKVNQEFEDGEQEFVYEIKTNGHVEYSSIEIEQEKGKELEVTLQLGRNEDTAKIYEFTKKIKNHEELLEIEVYEGEDNLIESILVKTLVKPDGSKVNEYIFQDGSSKEIDD